jgi:hypothetical protein
MESNEIIYLLTLEPHLILKGQIWRVFTFMFIPVYDSLFFGVILFFFLTMVSQGIEQAWGNFRTTVFIISGTLLIVIATILAWLLGYNQVATGYYLLQACIVAFGILYPNHTILLFFVLPVKMKYVAMLGFGLTFFDFLNFGERRLVIILSFLNLGLWVGPMILNAARQRAKVTARRREYDSKSISQEEAFHRCGECGKTEHDDRHLEFRVASDGEEYCANCLPGVKARLGK